MAQTWLSVALGFKIIMRKSLFVWLYQKRGGREENSSAIAYNWHFLILNETTQIWAKETYPREKARAKKGGAGTQTVEPSVLLSATVHCVSLGTSRPFWKHSPLRTMGLVEAQTGRLPGAVSYWKSILFHATYIYWALTCNEIVRPGGACGYVRIGQSTWVQRT